MPDFHVRIDGELPSETVHAINHDIQQVVLQHVGDLGRDDGDATPVAVLIPHRDWLGFVLRVLQEEFARETVFPDLDEFAKRFGGG